jgi:hypothetical protein
MHAARLGLVCAAAAASTAGATPGDTTWVHTFDQEFINWATPHHATFTMPADPANWSTVTLFVTIECPGAPDDCDPWDRLGHLRIVTPDQGDVEIARFITPYDITGTGLPGSCAWTHGVTDFKSLLTGNTELRLYIESWIGGTSGWVVTTDFAFVEGTLDPEPYRVVNLWQEDHVEYGNPSNPVTTQIQPLVLDVPAGVTGVDVRVYATGHGQGNTLNCAEFCNRVHTLVVGATPFAHNLWRSNCGVNPCSPQLGTWGAARAGWCPGDKATPWVVDVGAAVTPGQQVTLDYQIEAYENLCRPGNPGCTPGVTCPDCNYNSTGHTEPHYTIQASAVLFKPRAEVVSASLADPTAADAIVLRQNSPNPFRPETTFEYEMPRPGEAEVRVHDSAGRIVVAERRVHHQAGAFRYRWDGRDSLGRLAAAGVYFYSVRVEGRTEARKMIRVR